MTGRQCLDVQLSTAIYLLVGLWHDDADMGFGTCCDSCCEICCYDGILTYSGKVLISNDTSVRNLLDGTSNAILFAAHRALDQCTLCKDKVPDTHEYTYHSWGLEQTNPDVSLTLTLGRVTDPMTSQHVHCA